MKTNPPNPEHRIHSKPVALYVESINGYPELVTEDRVSHIDIEIDKIQAAELLVILKARIDKLMGTMRIRFTGRIQH